MLSNSKKRTQKKPRKLCKRLIILLTTLGQTTPIDFENARVIDKGSYRVRKTLESWHSAKTINADNNSKPLPRQYSILLGLSIIFLNSLSAFTHFLLQISVC